MNRLARKFETARKLVPGPVIEESNGAEIGILAYGTTHWAVIETLDQLKKGEGIEAGYCRVRAYPFGDGVADFVGRHQRVYVDKIRWQ